MVSRGYRRRLPFAAVEALLVADVDFANYGKEWADAKIAAIPAVDYERIGERMYAEFMFVSGDDAAKVVDAAKKVAAKKPAAKKAPAKKPAAKKPAVKKAAPKAKPAAKKTIKK